MCFDSGLDTCGDISSCGGADNPDGAKDGLSHNVSGVSNKEVKRCSPPSCGVLGDGYSLRVQSEGGGVNARRRAARARACEARRKVTWSSGQSSGMGEPISRVSSRKASSLVMSAESKMGLRVGGSCLREGKSRCRPRARIL